mmetsp:Transcript_32206/g.39194  ORF Transcript_32206/g.39194 Transcript_32206/m.39194 type:complete len:82 (+) Transcript_32206:268-513(+)
MISIKFSRIDKKEPLVLKFSRKTIRLFFFFSCNFNWTVSLIFVKLSKYIILQSCFDLLWISAKLKKENSLQFHHNVLKIQS